MNRKKNYNMRKICLLLFSSILLLPVFAQQQTIEQEGVGVLKSSDVAALEVSLIEARRYAIEHNRSIQNASLAIKQQEAARWQTIASMLPQVNAELDYVDMCGYQMPIMGREIPMNAYGTAGIKASIAFTGNQVVATLINNIAIQMADVSQKKTEQVVNNNVVTTYVTILTLQRTIELYEKNLLNMQDLYRRAQKAVDVGAAEQISADQIEVQVNTYKSAITTYKQNKEIMISMLRLYMGLGMETDLKLTEKLEDLMSPEQCLNILNIDFKIEDNYDYQLATKQTELANKQITLAAMNYVPTVAAFYQYTAKTYFGQDSGMDTTAPNMIGVSMSIPIWSSGQRASAITEKKLAYQSAQNTLLDTEDQLNISNYQLRFNMQNEYEKYKVQEQNVEVSQKVLDNTSKKFEFGYASSTDVTTANQTLITAQTQYVSALLATVEAFLNLKDLLNINDLD